MTDGDKLLPLCEAVQRATGWKPHLATPIRWSQKGVGGIRLRTFRVGGRHLTSVNEVLAFIRNRTVATDGEQIQPKPGKTTPSIQKKLDRVLA